MDPPESFSFPFEPYDIQKSFMKEIYKVLESGKLGIFESPTGTGKSLSLCCSALQWLKDHEAKERAMLSNEIEKLKISSKDDKTDGDDWLYSEYDKIKKNLEMNNLKTKLDRINLHLEKINKLRSRRVLKRLDTNTVKKKWTKLENVSKEDASKNFETPDEAIDVDDADFLLQDITNVLVEPDDNENEESDRNSSKFFTKIYFCSRTHSQLSQFVNEIKRTIHHSDISVVSLSSRQQCCINSSVQKLKSQHLINEHCLDLQKGKKGKATSKAEDGKVTKRSKNTCGCPYYNQTKIDLLKDEVLIEIKDVEDLIENAKELKACPYYSARAAIKDAQVIVVPYQTLLHEPTRCANGIDLKNNIVIIDEAHNLLETIGHIHSAEVNGNQLQTALEKLKQYRTKYNTRFAAKNLLFLGQFIYIVGRILETLKKSPSNENNETNSKMYNLEEFVLKAEIDNYNIRPILDFCTHSKLAQKLHGFANKYPKEEIVKKESAKFGGLENFLGQISKKKIESTLNTQDQTPNIEKYISVGNVIQSVINFLSTLTSAYTDGRILVFKDSNFNSSYLKFLLLNPAAQFSNIIKDARAVIVAGGTMQPFSEFREQLFISAGAPLDRITEFSCGHVIPPKNILPICLSDGPSGKKLNFTYEIRKTKEMLNEIGRVLVNTSNVIPGGIVCFFPSYDYEKTVYDHLYLNGFIDTIQRKKKVFREPKTTGQVDQVLDDYSKIIKRCKSTGFDKASLTGALMLSVVGGKLSEGLNFSDDLGRCVIVIGMPYPSMKSPELQEKMKYLKENVSATAGNVHYENLCLKAVNQCIGRAVRHAKDYATVILMDERYSRDSVCNSLPKWIQESLMVNTKFSTAIGSIGKFFIQHKISQ